MPDVKSGQYEDVLLEMRRRWDYATDQWQEIRDEAKIDMRYVSGDPWENRDRRAREDAGRPVLSLDELGQYTNQLINSIRQHKRAGKVTPIGSGATDKTAETRGDLFRQIEYRSNAQQAYTIMFENTVNRSYGYFRIKSQYVTQPKTSGGDGSNMNQELIIDPIVNPDLVTIDPDSIKPDGSDMTHAWIAETWGYEEYRKKFPKARVQDFDAQMSKDAPTWMTVSKIRLAEYWTIELTKRTLLLFKNGVTREDGTYRPLEVFEDEWKKGKFPWLVNQEPDDERPVESPTVKSYLTNGFEVLGEPTVWPGKSIPIVCCYGKTLYVDDGSGAEKKILSLVRLARDPFMLYCYYRTAEAEQVGMSTKFPYFIRRGSLTQEQQLKLQQSLHEPVAFIEVNATSDQMPPGMVPEMPVRNPFEPAIQALEVGAEAARRAIQSAMGVSPLPTSAQRKNDKSGVALKQIEDSEDQGSFHFVDAYDMALQRGFEILNEVADVFYDTARDVTVRNGQDVASQVRLNDPMSPKGHITLGPGYDHDVTISTGPHYDSEREQANDFADVLVGNINAIAPVIGPQAAAKLMALSVKLKNLGPIGDEIAELLSPPQPEGGLPPQIQQAMQQLQGENQQLKLAHEIDTAKQQATLEKAKIDAQSAQTIAAQRAQVELEKAWIAVSAQLVIAAQKVGAENARSLAEALDSRDAAALGATLDAITHVSGVVEAAKDRSHEANMALLEHQHAMQQAEQGQAHALEQGEQAHQGALEQGQQAAELAPEPAE